MHGFVESGTRRRNDGSNRGFKATAGDMPILLLAVKSINKDSTSGSKIYVFVTLNPINNRLGEAYHRFYYNWILRGGSSNHLCWLSIIPVLITYKIYYVLNIYF